MKNALTTPATDAPKAPLATARFEHPGKKVFVLLPYNGIDERTAKEFLEDELALMEKPPALTNTLKVGMLTDQYVVYVAHALAQRVKGEDGRYAFRPALTVLGPYVCTDFLAPSISEDDMSTVNVQILVDTIQGHLGPQLVARLSADKIPQDKTLKLHST